MAFGVEPCHSSLSRLMRRVTGVAVEKIAAVFLGKLIVGVIGDAGDGGGTVIVVGDARSEAEAIVLLADAFVVAAVLQHVDGLRVGVGAVEIAERIDGEAKGIRLAVGVNLEGGTIRAEPVSVAAFEQGGVAR